MDVLPEALTPVRTARFKNRKAVAKIDMVLAGLSTPIVHLANSEVIFSSTC